MALTRLWHIRKDITVAVWEMTESLKELQNSLSIYNLNLPNFKNEQRLKEWYTARLLSLKLLNSPNIEYSSQGKPIIKNSEYNISISHSHKYLALAFSKTQYLGLDIQQISNKTIKILTKFTTDKERTLINNSIEKASIVWAAKEAMYKLSFTKPESYKNELLINEIEQNYLKTQIFKQKILSEYLKIDNYYLCLALSENKIV